MKNFGRLAARVFTLSVALTVSGSAFAGLSIDDPVVLSQLEEKGLDLSRWIFGTSERIRDNATLGQNQKYRAIASVIAA
ncbi:MAG: hypothetical protein AAB250_05530, partial [Bdellovibrionota bacterium]